MTEQDDNEDIVERRLLNAASQLTALIGSKIFAAPDPVAETTSADESDRPRAAMAEKR